MSDSLENTFVYFSADSVLPDLGDLTFYFHVLNDRSVYLENSLDFLKERGFFAWKKKFYDPFRSAEDEMREEIVRGQHTTTCSDLYNLPPDYLSVDLLNILDFKKYISGKNFTFSQIYSLAFLRMRKERLKRDRSLKNKNAFVDAHLSSAHLLEKYFADFPTWTLEYIEKPSTAIYSRNLDDLPHLQKTVARRIRKRCTSRRYEKLGRFK